MGSFTEDELTRVSAPPSLVFISLTEFVPSLAAKTGVTPDFWTVEANYIIEKIKLKCEKFEQVHGIHVPVVKLSRLTFLSIQIPNQTGLDLPPSQEGSCSPSLPMIEATPGRSETHQLCFREPCFILWGIRPRTSTDAPPHLSGSRQP